ncbi:hypothetical protein [Sphingomonas hylomeconis]|uniref:Uncharacterized protein n=1 Tax=Sphingomonas hylomeconis TaxID=1395958 RepID=A0ABV7SPP1_9SPHN|nr:hypothetical protein [Sphingomonas hylomeconis]
MNHDQKPARVRVVAATAPAAVPTVERRHTDNGAAMPADLSTSAARSGIAKVAAAALFLLACVLGGIAEAVLNR